MNQNTSKNNELEISNTEEEDELAEDDSENEDDSDDEDTEDDDTDEDEEDEEDEDIEADLDAILKERIAAGDDQEDDDNDDDSISPRGAATAGEAEVVTAKGENEFLCPHCFLLVNIAAIVDNECPHCGGPLGET